VRKALAETGRLTAAGLILALLLPFIVTAIGIWMVGGLAGEIRRVG
jgi:hypothetical protein